MIGRLVLAAALSTLAAAPLFAHVEVPGTYGDAMRWYRLTAEKGDARAQFLLGYMYEAGERMAPDPALARAWYAKAAAQGEPRASFRLARLHHEGRGGAADLEEAARLYRAAAERGHVGAQSMLGYLYATGEGVPRDETRAFLWLTLAAKGGDDAAAENLARLAQGMTRERIAAGEALVNDWSPKR